MLVSPTIVTAVVAVLAVVQLSVLVFVAVLGVKFRRIPLARTLALLEDLTKRQRELECRVSELGIQVAARGAEAVSPGVKHPVPPPQARRIPTHRFDAAEPSAISGPTLIAVPNLASNATEAPSEASQELASRFGSIWEMADDGTPADAIARRIGQPVGQVELILALRRQLAADTRRRDRDARD